MGKPGYDDSSEGESETEEEVEVEDEDEDEDEDESYEEESEEESTESSTLPPPIEIPESVQKIIPSTSPKKKYDADSSSSSDEETIESSRPYQPASFWDKTARLSATNAIKKPDIDYSSSDSDDSDSDSEVEVRRTSITKSVPAVNKAASAAPVQVPQPSVVQEAPAPAPQPVSVPEVTPTSSSTPPNDPAPYPKAEVSLAAAPRSQVVINDSPAEPIASSNEHSSSSRALPNRSKSWGHHKSKAPVNGSDASDTLKQSAPVTPGASQAAPKSGSPKKSWNSKSVQVTPDSNGVVVSSDPAPSQQQAEMLSAPSLSVATKTEPIVPEPNAPARRRSKSFVCRSKPDLNAPDVPDILKITGSATGTEKAPSKYLSPQKAWKSKKQAQSNGIVKEQEPAQPPVETPSTAPPAPAASVKIETSSVESVADKPLSPKKSPQQRAKSYVSRPNPESNPDAPDPSKITTTTSPTKYLSPQKAWKAKATQPSQNSGAQQDNDSAQNQSAGMPQAPSISPGVKKDATLEKPLVNNSTSERPSASSSTSEKPSASSSTSKEPIATDAPPERKLPKPRAKSYVIKPKPENCPDVPDILKITGAAPAAPTTSKYLSPQKAWKAKNMQSSQSSEVSSDSAHSAPVETSPPAASETPVVKNDSTAEKPKAKTDSPSRKPPNRNKSWGGSLAAKPTNDSEVPDILKMSASATTGIEKASKYLSPQKAWKSKKQEAAKVAPEGDSSSVDNPPNHNSPKVSEKATEDPPKLYLSAKSPATVRKPAILPTTPARKEPVKVTAMPKTPVPKTPLPKTPVATSKEQVVSVKVAPLPKTPVAIKKPVVSAITPGRKDPPKATAVKIVEPVVTAEPPKKAVPPSVSGGSSVEEETATDPAEEENNPLAWKKPDWAKKKVLKKSEKGDLLKHGATLSAPITNFAEVVAVEKQDLGFKKPEWTEKAKLKNSDVGEKLKHGDTISRPIGGIKTVDE